MRGMATILSLLFALPVHAQVTLDFEDEGGPGCPVPPLDGVSNIETKGFSVFPGGDPPALVTCDSMEASAASNGSYFLLSGAEPITGKGAIQVQRRTPSGDRLPFSVFAFDAAELAVSAPGYSVRVWAYDEDENTVADVTFVFDGVIDGPGGVEDFETFALPASFEDVYAVTFQGQDVSSGGDFYAVDDIVVAPSQPQVPALSLPLRAFLVLLMSGAPFAWWSRRTSRG